MRGTLRLSIGASLLLLLASCATVKPGIDFNRSQAHELQSLALLEPTVPDRALVATPEVVSAAGLVGGFIGSIIGSAIDSANQDRRSDKFEAMVAERGFIAGTVFAESLQAALEAHGYTVRRHTAARPGNGLLERYDEGLPAEVDAYLDVVVESYGFAYRQGFYAPVAVIRCRLIAADTKTVLMEQTAFHDKEGITAGLEGREKNAVYVPATQTITFADAGQILDAPDKSIPAIELVLRQSAKTVADLIN